MNLDNTQTLTNLVRAYITETVDGARYQFLRHTAMMQQQIYVANTLKLLATNEMAHAKIWWDFITEKDTKSRPNIDVKAGFPFETGDFIKQFSIVSNVEKHEGETLYLEFGKIAQKEGFDEIAKKFQMTAEIERQHSAILKQLYDGLKSGKLYKADKVSHWKCIKCGHIMDAKNAWQYCPLCGVEQGYAEGQILLK